MCGRSPVGSERMSYKLSTNQPEQTDAEERTGQATAGWEQRETNRLKILCGTHARARARARTQVHYASNQALQNPDGSLPEPANGDVITMQADSPGGGGEFTLRNAQAQHLPVPRDSAGGGSNQQQQQRNYNFWG